MITSPIFRSTNDNIVAYETLYQQALDDGRQFHVLKDIREAINKLKKALKAMPRYRYTRCCR